MTLVWRIETREREVARVVIGMPQREFWKP